MKNKEKDIFDGLNIPKTNEEISKAAKEAASMWKHGGEKNDEFGLKKRHYKIEELPFSLKLSISKPKDIPLFRSPKNDGWTLLYMLIAASVVNYPTWMLLTIYLGGSFLSFLCMSIYMLVLWIKAFININNSRYFVWTRIAGENKQSYLEIVSQDWSGKWISLIKEEERKVAELVENKS